MTRAFYFFYIAVLQVTYLQCSISQSVLQKPDGEHAEFLHRFRRRINNYEGVGPVEYMKQLRDEMVDESGSPKDPENDPTSIWCLMDKDVVDDKYHPKPVNRKCNMVQKFNYSLQSLSSEFNSNTKLSQSFLRVYLQPITRLLPVGKESVDLKVTITAKAFSNNSDCAGGTTFISSHLMTVSSTTQDHWAEWNITDGFKNCWDSVENISYVEFSVQFHKVHCVPGKKKIPIEIANPATIPVDQEERRSRHWPLQPFVLIYLDDEEEKRKMLHFQKAVEPEEFIIDDMEDENTKVKRAVVPPCRLKPHQINFANLGMHHILSPYAYNAGQCLGDCSKQSVSDNNINNHARLLASARVWYEISNPNISDIPYNPRCVSLSYQSLTLLVVKRDGMLEHKTYPNMATVSCGCRA